MKLIKHMEAVFVASAAFAVGGAYLADSLPPAHAAPARVAASAPANAVVVIKARRMTAEEKQQMVLNEGMDARRS